MKLQTISWKLRDIKEVYLDVPMDVTKLVKIIEPQTLYDQFRWLFDGETVEKFVVFWLSAANKVTGFEVISVGMLSSSVVDPRGVFRGAIVNNCCNIILAHNHPSGNLEPSQEDLSITKKLVEAGNIVGIHVFDHIIFGDGFTSFLSKRLI